MSFAGPPDMAEALVVGCGAVGVRAARLLAGTAGIGVCWVGSSEGRRAETVAASVGVDARPTGAIAAASELAARLGDPALAGVEVVVLCGGDAHAPMAAAGLRAGRNVVSTASDPDDIARMSDLDVEARARGRRLVLGAGFAPGLSCLLSSFVASRFDSVDSLRVSVAGAGGPACAKATRAELTGIATEFRSGWSRRRAGRSTGLVWFPEPIGGRRTALARSAVPMLVHPVVGARLSTVSRTVERRSFGRPREHLGAVRVELEGAIEGKIESLVLGVVDRPSAAAGVVAGVVASASVGLVDGVTVPVGAHGAAAVDGSAALLVELARAGVRAAEFVGA